MSDVINLFVIAAIGVIVADLVAHGSGTATLFSGIGNLWSTAVQGMMGQTVGQTNIQGGSTTPGTKPQ